MKKVKSKVRYKGAIPSGTLYAVFILLAMIGLSFLLIGGKLPSTRKANTSGQQVIIASPSPASQKGSLQLYMFSGVTVTPGPTATPIPTTSPTNAPTNTPTPTP